MFDFAVIMPTLLRPSLVRACRSVFEQDVDGSINLLIGVDLALGDRAVLDEVRALARPPKRTVTIVDLGYSTATLRGGVFPCRGGGGLRSALSFLANARHLAFLDDDNWFEPHHLSSLARVIEGKPWAFSLRTFIDSRIGAPLGVDQWESVGPGLGVHVKQFGGFCDTSTYMLDTLAAEDVLPHWSYGVSVDGSGVDRRIFQLLRRRPHGASGLATVNYTLQHTDLNHRARLRWLEKAGAKPSWPTSFAEAAARLRRDLPAARDVTAGEALSAATIEALRSLLVDAKASTAVLVGAHDPALARLVEETAATRQASAGLLHLEATDPNLLEALRSLRTEEVLADISYLGPAPTELVGPLLHALWAITRRTGALIGHLAPGPDGAAQRPIIERFAFERATPLAWLGPAESGCFHLPRY